MKFAHDTREALLAAADLINTRPGSSLSGEDELATVEDVEAFFAAHGYSGSRQGDGEELQALRAVRPRLRRLWTGDADAVVSMVNGLLVEFNAVPQMVRHDGWDWHIHAVDGEAPLADRVAVETAMALVDLLRAGELGRLRQCEADDCQAVLIDLSRNRSKRYCDVGNCGNRANVAAYRARKAAEDAK